MVIVVCYGLHETLQICRKGLLISQVMNSYMHEQTEERFPHSFTYTDLDYICGNPG